MKINRKVISLLLVCALVLPLAGCFKDKTTTHKLAIFTGQADAALVAFSDAVHLFQTNNRLAPETAKSIYNLNLRIAIAVDVIRNRAEQGFKKAEALEIIKQTLVDARAAEQQGLIGLTGDARKKFQEITFFAIFTLESIEAVIAATKEPAPPATVEIASAARGRTRAIQQGEDTVWTDLVLILQKAVLKGLEFSRFDQATAFSAGRTLNTELQNVLRARIAALNP